MAIPVPLQKDEIVVFLRKAFSDYFSFDVFLACGLNRLLTDVLDGRLAHNKVSAKYLADHYVPISLDKTSFDQMKIVVSTAYLAVVQQSQENSALIWNRATLLEHYPSFSHEDTKEIDFLLVFRNLMAVALTFVPAKGSKIFLIKMIERLEGSNNEYVTGSGQKAAVTRRVSIYETEGNVRAKRKVDNDAPVAKRASFTPTATTHLEAPAYYRAESASALAEAEKAAVEEAMNCYNLFPKVTTLQRMGTFDYETLCSDLQPDMGKVLKDFAYTGTITDDIFSVLEDFADANMAMLA